MTVRLAAARLPAPRTPFSSRRAFIAFPGAPEQHLTATRTLPYAASPLYDLIADVDSYQTFVPYCSHSRVTAWSPPDPETGVRSPTLADLHVGWGGFDEIFTSRLRCVPGQSVEAASGGQGREDASAVFKTLLTRWSLRPLQAGSSPSTQVSLDIRYQFVNPFYAAVSSAVSDKVAGLMIEAFETQARKKLASAP